MKTKELELLLKNGIGVLPNQAIDTLKDLGFIQNSNVNPGPASLDITLGEECYEIDQYVFPKKNQKIQDLIFTAMNGRKFEGNILSPGKKYLIAHSEKFRLPNFLYGYANPKSTTGRNFVHTRMMTDFVDMFDHLPRGHKGKIWSYVIPNTWPISFEPGKDSLNQVRMIIKDSRLSDFELMSLQQKNSVMKSIDGDSLEFGRSFIRGGDHGYMIFSIDCQSKIAGYVAKENQNPVAIGKSSCVDWKDYFEVIEGREYIELVPNKFYILSSLEKISMPSNMASEVKTVDVRLGDFRSHYAGFIDPGFGDSEFGNNITLEVKVEERMQIRNGQAFFNVHFEKMACLPDKLYADASGNYKIQYGPKLARQFC